jgi:hypothetical protein
LTFGKNLRMKRASEKRMMQMKRCVNEPRATRMKHGDGIFGVVREVLHERSARRAMRYSHVGRPEDFSWRHEERSSCEVSIAAEIGERRTASVWLSDFVASGKPNQSLEPTRVLGTSAAEPPRVPSTRVAHL